VIRSDGKAAYVTHLVGSAMTRIDGLDGAPKARSVALPAAPLRAPFGRALDASLGYAATLSPDGKRLFVARHALGALGADDAWFGAATVDVLSTSDDTPLAPERAKPLANEDEIHVIAPEDVFIQPRAVIYRKATRTLLIASEGQGMLTELDALSLAGRVASEGPYGWHGQNGTIGERVREGLHLHRWDDPPGGWKSNEMLVEERVSALGLFVRQGLVPPPREKHDPTPAEARGKELFGSTASSPPSSRRSASSSAEPVARWMSLPRARLPSCACAVSRRSTASRRGYSRTPRRRSGSAASPAAVTSS
jgi:hypothetical protein